MRTNDKKNTDRLYFIDIMKVFAILLVVLGHTLNNWGLYEHPLNIWHMPIFFLLFGLLSLKSINRGMVNNIPRTEK